MRRERFVIALLMSVAAVFGGPTGCNGGKAAAPPSRTVVPSVGAETLDLASDIVSGCVHGAALVKVLIDLKPSGEGCAAEVTPASVCVAAGGVVRFKVQNGCGALGEADRPAVEITRPVFKRPLSTQTEPTDLRELFQNCGLKVQRIDRAASQVLLCDVAPDAYEGFYKYGLTGQIVPLDPDVEVRPGRK